MAHIVVSGAGLGGSILTCELADQIRPEDRITVITRDTMYRFVPSNPWIAVGWRQRDVIRFDLAPTVKKKGIDVKTGAAEKLNSAKNRVDLVDGNSVACDYLVIATGPELAFDEIPGLGPHGGHTQPACHVDHALAAKEVFEKLLTNPGPVIIGAVQGASCYGPACEFLFILETALRRAKVRDKVPMTFVTSEPYVGHLGLDGVGDAKGLLESEMRGKHINLDPGEKGRRRQDDG